MAKRKDVEEILAQREQEIKAETESAKERAEAVKKFTVEDKPKLPEDGSQINLDFFEKEADSGAKKPAKNPEAKSAPKVESEPKKAAKPGPKKAAKPEPKEAVPKEEPKQEVPVEVLPATEMVNLEMAVSDNCKLGFGRPRTIEGPGKAYQYFSREYGEWKLTPNYWWACQFGSGDINVVLVCYKDGKIDHLLTEREAEQYI